MSAAHRRRPSLARELIAGVAVIAVCVFALAGLMLERALRQQLDAVERQQLAGRMDVVEHYMREATQDGGWPALRHRLDDVLIGDGAMRIWVVGPCGVLYGGRHAPRMWASDDRIWHVEREDGVVLTGLRRPWKKACCNADGELIVALDTRGGDQLLDRYAGLLALVAALGMATTVTLAAWWTRRSLRPVHRIAAQAAGVAAGAAGLSVRLSSVNVEELQELVGSFNHALDRVQSAYEHMEAFGADVAHELRTPLAALINATEVELRQPRGVESLRETLQTNLGVLRELSGLVNDMLFLARADRGQLAQRAQACDLRAEALRVAEYFEPMLEECHQSLVVEGEVGVPCDATLIRRALVNLVGNATRYTAEGGAIHVILSQEGEWVRVAVRNPGPDIDPSLLPRLFERFFRVDQARSRSSQSHHGLGLAIVHAVAAMHEGRTFAHSSGGWTEIGFEFPSVRLPGP